MKYKKMLMNKKQNQRIEDTEQDIVYLFNLFVEREFPALGFIYNAAQGLWMFAGAEEMEQLMKSIPFAPCEEFDLAQYVSSLSRDDIFWMVDLSTPDLKLNRWQYGKAAEGV